MNHQLARARRFRQLNLQGGLLLPNAWDCASARIFEDAGFAAVGTTSGGIAYARGYPDGECIPPALMLAEVAAICRRLALPVTADIEAGYGAVATTVAAAIAAGAVGVNLEDRCYTTPGQPMLSVERQAVRLQQARAAAEQAGLPLWLTARCDAYLLGVGDDEDERLALTTQRANAYLAAGADMVFVPGLTEPAQLQALCRSVSGPLALMAQPGAPAAAELFAAGAQRVSLGAGAMLASMAIVREVAAEMLELGDWQQLARQNYGYAQAEALLAARLD